MSQNVNFIDVESYDYIKEKAEKEDTQVFVEYNYNNEKIIGVIKDEREYLLNSLYDKKELVTKWCDQYEQKNYRSIAVVFGIADGTYVRELRHKNEDMLIFVYEPSYTIANICMEQLDIGDIMEDEKILMVAGHESLKGLNVLLDNAINFEILRFVRMYISPNYDNVFVDELRALFEIYNIAMKRVVLNRNTEIAMRDELTDNITHNVVDCVNQYSVNNLIGAFESLDKEKIPAIVVAAGPSLDKNIMELKKAKGKAFIIAVDTALNPLAKADITPDITVSVDPHKPIVLFQNDVFTYLPMVFALSSNYKIKEYHYGMRIYQQTHDSIINKYLDKYEKENINLGSGGSVANDAFSLARVLGFRTIIFIGLDLAYPDDKGHSVESYGKDADNDMKNSGKELFEVEDIYGGKVKTEYNMNYYRNWFEQQATLYPYIKLIDATEGGAKKKGMEIMTLEEAIDRECIYDHNVDFGSIIAGTEPFFDESEKLSIIKELTDLKPFFDNMKKKIEDGKRAYKKLDELNRKRKYSGSDFRKTMDDIGKVNSWMNDDKEVTFVNLYNVENDYELRDVVMDEKENVYEEIKHISQNGIKMMDGLLESIERARRDGEIVSEDAKKILQKY